MSINWIDSDYAADIRAALTTDGRKENMVAFTPGKVYEVWRPLLIESEYTVILRYVVLGSSRIIELAECADWSMVISLSPSTEVPTTMWGSVFGAPILSDADLPQEKRFLPPDAVYLMYSCVLEPSKPLHFISLIERKQQ